MTPGAANADGQAVLYFSFGTDGATHRETAVAYRNATDAPATLTLQVYDHFGKLVEAPYLARDNAVTRLSQVD